MTDIAYPRRDGAPPMVRKMLRYPNTVREVTISTLDIKSIPTVTVTMEIPRDLYNGVPRWRAVLRDGLAFARKRMGV